MTRNLTRLIDERDTLKRQVETQSEIIARYRLRNSSLQRENEVLRAVVGEAGIRATQGDKNGG
jgi:L,D-peptidoglycan transpeptidase YkuD (ErfK/YbiS/YcfS/YnhG family)